MNLILLGPPGAGKGTQAQFIANKFNLYQLSTGDLLRIEVKKKTEIGKKIEEIIAHGDFVVDEIVNKLLEETICNPLYRNRMIFDGYPRNIKQAKNLEFLLNANNQSLNFILFLKVSRDVVEKRILERVICEKCKKIFNKLTDKEEIKNHECGINYLKKRDDDNQKTMITRYDEYMQKTEPVLDFYSSKSYFYEIDASQKIDEITSKIEQILTV